MHKSEQSVSCSPRLTSRVSQAYSLPADVSYKPYLTILKREKKQSALIHLSESHVQRESSMFSSGKFLTLSCKKSGIIGIHLAYPLYLFSYLQNQG